MGELPRDRVYVGAQGHVVALEGVSGREVWRTKVRGRGFVTVGVQGERLLAATGGYLYCLDPVTGSIVWENGLKGLGLGIVSISGGSTLESAALQADRQRRAAAS